MSRIGNAPIVLPNGVEFSIDARNNVVVKGPLGELSRKIDSIITIEKKENIVTLSRPTDDKETKAKHGLYRALLANMVKGVTEGYKKGIIINGVGYKVAINGNKMTLNVGFSHQVELEAPEGINMQILKANQIELSGIDKELVGQFASQIRDIRPVEPYHAYGIRYADEVVVRKEGKRAKK